MMERHADVDRRAWALSKETKRRVEDANSLCMPGFKSVSGTGLVNDEYVFRVYDFPPSP
jgi:hypothetical protein